MGGSGAGDGKGEGRRTYGTGSGLPPSRTASLLEPTSGTFLGNLVCKSRRQLLEVRMDCCGGPVLEETWMGSV